MNAKQTESDNWEACPPGEVGSLVTGLRRRRRVHNSKLAAGIAASVLFVVLLGNFALTTLSKPAPEFAAMNCRQLQGLAQDYVDGKLEEKVAVRVEQHAKKCKRCQALIARLKKEKVEEKVTERKSLPPDGSEVEGLLSIRLSQLRSGGRS